MLHDYMVKGTDSSDPHNTLKHHKRIINALKKKDADKAEAAVRAHLNDSWKNIIIYKKEHGEN